MRMQNSYVRCHFPRSNETVHIIFIGVEQIKGSLLGRLKDRNPVFFLIYRLVPYIA
jgi:hypothetical protein